MSHPLGIDTSGGLRLTSQVKARCTIRQDDFRGSAEVSGQLSFSGQPPSPLETLGIDRSGFIGLGFETPRGTTGKLSISSLSGTGTLDQRTEGWLFQSGISASVIYRAIQFDGDENQFAIADNDLFFAPTEKFTGTISMSLTPFSQNEGNRTLRVSSGFLQLSLRDETRVKGLIDEMTIDLAGQTLLATGSQEVESGFRRKIKLRAVRFKEAEDDPKPSGETWESQFEAAQRIWGSCCIELVALEPRLALTTNQIKFSKSSGLIVAKFRDDEVDIIEILFTAGKLAGGGGFTYQPGSGIDLVVLSDLNGQNDALLAHELGHVFRGHHPGMTGLMEGFWSGDPSSVLLDSSESETGKNPHHNTKGNCERAYNPAFREDGELCGFQA